MVPSKIQELAITSSEIYLDWLKDYGHGTEIITVESIQQSDKNIFCFQLNKKPYSVECLNMKIGEDIYFSDSFAIISYDEKKLKLQIRWIKEISPLLNVIANRAYGIVSFNSDMKFLVERVLVWYKEHGIELLIPMKSSANDKTEIEDFLAQFPLVSEGQKEAIRISLMHPFSYVWGAPGTGKTRYVLAHSILYHIQNGNKVLILAPTNNSLDQSLRGILQVLKENDVASENVFRLGVPTRGFYEDFPECCEDKHKQKTIQKLKADLEENQKKQERKKKRQEVLNCRERILVLRDSAHQYSDLEAQLTECQDRLKTKNMLYEHNAQSIIAIQKQIDGAAAYTKTLGFKLKSKFVSGFREKTSSETDRLIQKLSSTDSEREELIKDISELKKKEQLLEKQIACLNLDEQIDTLLKMLAICLNRPFNNLNSAEEFPDRIPDLLSELDAAGDTLREDDKESSDSVFLQEEESQLRSQLQSLNAGITQRLMNVFCKHKMQKVAKHLCRFLQRHFVGSCSISYQRLLQTF